MKVFVTGAGILSGLLLVLAVGCTIDSVRLNQRAQVYMEYGEYEKAEELLKKSLDNDHENPATRYWLGRCYQATGRIDRAIYEYGLAVRFAPSIETAQMAYIDILHEDQREEESLRATKAFLAHKDMLMGEYVRIANNFRDKGMDMHYITTLHYAQEKNLKDPTPSLALADYFAEKGDVEQTMKALSRAFEIDPYYPGLAEKLGRNTYPVETPEPPSTPEPSPLEKELREMN
jgi:tetratricopeptide (TPR) repeat protein